MTKQIRTGALAAFLAAAVATMAACGGGAADAAPLSGDLQRDLDAAQSAGIDLAPAGGRTEVVSAAELGAAPARSTARASRPTALPARRQTPAPQARTAEVAATPAPEQPAPAAEPLPPVGPRPTAPRPSRTPEPPGGYRSVGEVIGNAPFPINP
ncbi:MAG: hypothetical protein ACJ79S_20385 [Gemmatimonadaceae bacterium]